MRLQQHKSWNEIKTNDSWALFKIMGEFVNGFEKMSKIGPCVSIFGSARTPEDTEYYKLAVDTAKAIVKSGYGVITGGGPGIMEAANKGASEAGGTSRFNLYNASSCSFIYNMIDFCLPKRCYSVMTLSVLELKVVVVLMLLNEAVI